MGFPQSLKGVASFRFFQLVCVALAERSREGCPRRLLSSSRELPNPVVCRDIDVRDRQRVRETAHPAYLLETSISHSSFALRELCDMKMKVVESLKSSSTKFGYRRCPRHSLLSDLKPPDPRRPRCPSQEIPVEAHIIERLNSDAFDNAHRLRNTSSRTQSSAARPRQFPSRKLDH